MVRKKNHTITISAIIVIGLLFIFRGIIFSDWQSKILLLFSKPVNSPILNIFHIGTITRENKDLKTKLIEATEKEYNVSVLENENKILKDELKIRTDSIETIGSNVIGKNPVLESGSVIINRGEKDGIKVGKAVVFQNFLVGTIEEVKENISTVRLIISSRTLIPVTIVEAGTSGLLKSGLDNLVVEQVLTDKHINVGDKIVANNIGGTADANILIGEVSEIVSSPSDIYQTLKVKSPVDFVNLYFLFD